MAYLSLRLRAEVEGPTERKFLRLESILKDVVKARPSRCNTYAESIGRRQASGNLAGFSSKRSSR